MSAFAVDPAALLAVVDRMTEFDRQLEAHLGRAESSVAHVATSWDGAAAESERMAQQRWQDGARAMRGALGRLREIAEGAHENYSAAAAANVRNWG